MNLLVSTIDDRPQTRKTTNLKLRHQKAMYFTGKAGDHFISMDGLSRGIKRVNLISAKRLMISHGCASPDIPPSVPGP